MSPERSGPRSSRTGPPLSSTWPAASSLQSPFYLAFPSIVAHHHLPMARTTKRERRDRKRSQRANKQAAKASELRTKAMEFTLYCDEAGNTGTNYLDPAQPVHVIAGWLVPRKHEQAWLTDLAALSAEQSASELHGLKLLRTGKGCKLATKILEAGLRNACLPTSLVAFKGHCLALRVVETFLDPMTNPKAAWLPSGANETRRAAATFLWDEVRDAVRQFGACFKTPERATWGSAVTVIADAIDSSGAELRHETLDTRRISESLRNCLNPNVMDELINLEASGYWGSGRRHASMSLNFPAFLNFLRNLDPLLHNAKVDVIHDETHRFEAAFQQAIDLFKKLGRVDIVTESGESWRLSPGSYRSFETRDSKTTIGLQAADILAASVYKVAKRAHDDEPLGDHEGPLATLALGHDFALAMEGAIQRLPGMGSEAELSRLHGLALHASLEYFGMRDQSPSGGGHGPVAP